MRISTLLLTLTSLAAPLGAQDFQYTILYTGRTLGYARSPDSQSLNGPNTPSPNPAASAYQSRFAALTPKQGVTIRVGMGDNFAPTLNARTFFIPGAPRAVKDRYNFDGGNWQSSSAASSAATLKGATSIPFDNVAQFFIESGYHALVPGKHDFYYGPERLRDLARLLATSHTQMLAANLWISSSVNYANPRVPARYDKPKYETDFNTVSIVLPSTVFPYQRKFTVKNAQLILEAGVAVRRDLVPVRLAENPAAITTASVIGLAQVCWADQKPGHDPEEEVAPPPNPPSAAVPANCAALAKVPQLPAKLSPDVQYTLGANKLIAGRNHLICLQLGQAVKWSCKPFTVAVPFFEYGAPVAPQTTPRRYALVPSATPGAPPVAIFGVVDPDMLTNIGLLNTGWLNTGNRRWDTSVKAAAPDAALEQLLDECELEAGCKDARKVLLAQMSYARAAQLATHLKEKFDVVLSEADADHNTGLRDLTETTADGPALLLTPPVPYQGGPELKGDLFVPQVSAATITRTGASHWELHNQIAKAPAQDLTPNCTNPCVTLEQIAKTVLDRHRIATPPAKVPPPPSTIIGDLALYAMRQPTKADVAMLQKRDFFNADRLGAAPFSLDQLQQQIETIFWKGDLLWTVNVTGAQLKSLVKQSAKFDAADDDPLATEVEKNRGLLFAGFSADPDDPKTFYVNGSRIADTDNFTLATTDYLGLGDTGYTDLASPAIPPPLRFKDFRSMKALAGVICTEISSAPPFTHATCDNQTLHQDYFDQTTLAPPDTSPGMNTAKQYATFLKDFVNPKVSPPNSPEGSAQQRHFFSLTLESGDFSFNAVMLRRADKMSKTFTGVSAPGVTSKGTSTVGEDHKLRGVWDFRLGTMYLLSDSAFQRTKNTTTFIPSTTANMYGFEYGGTWRWPVKNIRPSWFAFQYSGRFEGQFTQPDPVQITLTPQPDTKAADLPLILTIPAPQTSTIFGRAGARADFGDTWFELGLEQIDSRHLLSQYIFNVGNTKIYCQPSAQVQFACGTDPTPNSALNTTGIGKDFSSVPAQPVIAMTDYLTGGAYFNFNLKLPLWSRQDPSGADLSYYFTLANKGDWYFNSRNDTNVQTRYMDKLTPSLTIPLYGKLTLTPKMDIILYENKVNRNHFRALQPSVALSYTFKWRQGMRFYRALKYGAITTAQPAAPGGK